MERISKTLKIIFLILIGINYGLSIKIPEEKNFDIEITAHRGDSFNYPENTLSAFIGAQKSGSDWIELDVHQTKDKKLIIIHDNNFKRTTGVNKLITKVKYNEILTYNIFNEHFKDEKIPLLEDVIKYAKDNNLQLNIELKKSKHEKDYESSVVALINKYDFKDNCIVSSLKYSVIEKVKELDTSIKTLYVMRNVNNDILKYDKADEYSVKRDYITKELVNIIHNGNKKIHVWTVDNEIDINKMIDLKVDNIITNNVALTKDTINKRKNNKWR